MRLTANRVSPNGRRSASPTTYSLKLNPEGVGVGRHSSASLPRDGRVLRASAEGGVDNAAQLTDRLAPLSSAAPAAAYVCENFYR